MTDTLWGIALAALVFFGLHLMPSLSGLRARLIDRLTPRGYRGALSLLSIGALFWLGMAHSNAPYVELWSAGAWARLRFRSPPCRPRWCCWR